jgi:hypothetical protein
MSLPSKRRMNIPKVRDEGVAFLNNIFLMEFVGDEGEKGRKLKHGRRPYFF